jgi:hypothetical protein
MVPGSGGETCILCTPGFRDTWTEIMEAAIAKREQVSIGNIYSVLKQLRPDYPYQRGAMEKHMRQHDLERYEKINLVRRGRVGTMGDQT